MQRGDFSQSALEEERLCYNSVLQLRCDLLIDNRQSLSLALSHSPSVCVCVCVTVF